MSCAERPPGRRGAQTRVAARMTRVGRARGSIPRLASCVGMVLELRAYVFDFVNSLPPHKLAPAQHAPNQPHYYTPRALPQAHGQRRPRRVVRLWRCSLVSALWALGTEAARGAAPLRRARARAQGPAARGGLADEETGERAGRARWPRTRRAVVVCPSRPGRSAESTLASRQAQAHDLRERGKKARGTALTASSSVLARSFQEADVKQRWSGAKMNAEAIVLRELKSGRNSDRLANALSLLTSLT
jgi:hypothetical protein